MSIFASQFDRARSYAQTYTGAADDPSWRTPAAAADRGAIGAAAAAAAVGAVAAAGLVAGAGWGPGSGSGSGEGWDADWGEGWDEGWTYGQETGADGGAGYQEYDGGSWLARGDYTDAGVGGDDDFFYFIDGDSSLAIG